MCSNPICKKLTSGPHTNEGQAINLGVAAHIRGARYQPNNRFDPTMTDEERADITNGIWLCAFHAKEIDTDQQRFAVALLQEWKANHEALVAADSKFSSLAKPIFKVTAPTAFKHLLTLDVNVFRTVAPSEDMVGFFPVILTLENIPESSAFSETDTVWAQIAYIQHGMELERVVGCWVGHPLQAITFPFRTPRYLIVGGWYCKSKTPTLNEFRMFEFSRDLHRAMEHPSKMAAPRGLVVEVILTPNGHHDRHHKYRFILELVGPGFFKFFELKSTSL